MTRPLEWMAAVRDHPERPSEVKRLVLWALALRLDWQTGCGYASVTQLAADADCQQRTVKYATKWGRDHELLVQARRGHRLGDGTVRASEWRLRLPVSTGTGMHVETVSRGTDSNLKVHPDASQGAPSNHPSRPRSSRPRSSADDAGAKAPRAPQPKPERCAMCRISDHEHCTGCHCTHAEANGHDRGQFDYFARPVTR